MRGAFRLKLRLLSALAILAALVFIVRLYFVQIVDGDAYARKAERQYENTAEAVFDRGTIYGTRKDGTLVSVATVQSGFRLAMNPSNLTNPERAYELISPVVEVPRDEFFEAASHTDDPYEVLATRLPDETGRAIEALGIESILVERERWRSYPAGTNAAQTIGFVAYDNDDTLAGRTGLERYYEDVLTRKDSGLFGNFFAELFSSVKEVTGDPRSVREGDIVTSLEPVVEEKLMQTLEEVNSRYASVETSGIIMDPSTGEIIALGTVPSFDPNDFSQADPAHFANPLVEHRYEFGSIVKALTMAAGLDAGVITSATTYEDRGTLTLNGKTISNYDGKARGVVPMQEVLSQSLNTGVAFIAGRLGHERFRGYVEALGMGTETGIDLPGEVAGDIENIRTSPRDIEYATASYGQGIALSPVAMLRALGALANGGEVVTPHLARAVRLESGITKELAWGEGERVFSKEATEETTRMLVKVVDESLAGGQIEIPEMSVAAKTGTAQIPGPGGAYAEGKYLHSFFGYFPAYDPKFIVLLYTREPQGVQYASETLALPFMELARYLMHYYDLPPDRGDYTTLP